MASRSLGVLTLDLVAKVGSFTDGMDKAGRTAKKTGSSIEDAAKKAGLAMAGLGSAAVAGAAALVASTANSAKEIRNLSAVAGTGVEDFQRMTFAAKAFGVEQDKVSDILKDTQDKIGDFLSTGGGEMADFFEKVAPLVGVTADNFRDLSGSDALQLYVNSLEKANLSQAEMTFYLEAIASDATLLLPLLKNNGAELKRMGQQADALNVVLSELEIQQLEEVAKATRVLEGALQGAGNQVAVSLLPAITELTGVLQDQQTVAAIQSVVTGIGDIATGAVKAGVEIVNLTRYVAESFAAMSSGAAADDIVRLEDQLQQLQDIRNSGALDRIRFFGKDGIIEVYSDAELDAEIADVEKKIQAFYARQEEQAKVLKVALPEPPKAAPPVLTTPTTTSLPPTSSITEQDNALKQLQERYQSAIDDYRRQLELTGEITEAQRLRFEVENGGLKGVTEAQHQQLSDLALAVDQQKAMTDAKREYADLVALLRTDEEKAADTLRDQLRILEAMADLEPDERKTMAARIAGAATEEAPRFQGLAPEFGGASGELVKLDDAQAELENWYSTQLGLLDQFRSERADLSATWDAEELELHRQHAEELTRIDQARQQLALSSAEDLFGSLADIARTAQGENSAIFKAAFVAEKAAAIARAGVAIQTGIAMAAANPFPANLAAMASVAAATAGIVSNIQSIGMAGMAHEGIDSVPKTGTWLLEKGERVTTEKTSAKLDRTLADVQRKLDRAPAGGRVVNQTFKIETPNADSFRMSERQMMRRARQRIT